MSLPGYPEFDDDPAPFPVSTEDRLILECRDRSWRYEDGVVVVEGWDPDEGAALAALGGIDGAILRIWRSATRAVRALQIVDGTDLGPQIVAAVQMASHPNGPTPPSAGPLTWVLLAEHPKLAVRKRVASAEDAPAPALYALADRPELAEDLASNPACPPGLLARLALSTVESVRVAVAGNIATPLDTLSRLRLEPSARVRDAANAAIARMR